MGDAIVNVVTGATTLLVNVIGVLLGFLLALLALEIFVLLAEALRSSRHAASLTLGSIENLTGEDDTRVVELRAMVLEYITAGGLSVAATAPGLDAVDSQLLAATTEPSASFSGATGISSIVSWLVLALTRRPMHVLTGAAKHREDDSSYGLSFQITQLPRKKVICATTLWGEKPNELADLAEKVGAYVFWVMANQPLALQRTSRWLRWSAEGGESYRHYRRALEHAKEESMRSEAFAAFEEAKAAEPSNLLIRLRYGTLLEEDGKYEQAISQYYGIIGLWPEHIGTRYRLASACWNLLMSKDLDQNSDTEYQVDAEWLHMELLRQLRTPWLLRRLLRTYRPSSWQPSERPYWKSWLMTWIESGHSRYSLRRSKARCFREAVKVLDRTIEVTVTHARVTALNRRPIQQDFDPIQEDLDRILSRPTLPRRWRQAWESARRRQYRAADSTNRGSKGRLEIKRPVDARHGQYRLGVRRSVGWLARYNAACLHSLLIGPPPGEVGSSEYESWAEETKANVQDALLELQLVFRDPYSQLPGAWVAADPSLKYLKCHPRAKDWLTWFSVVDRRSQRARRPGIQ